MKLQEIATRCNFSKEEIGHYRTCGLISAEEELTDADIDRLSCIALLKKAGWDCAAIARFLAAEHSSSEQIAMLRRLREELLQRVHELQRTLDKIDYLIYQRSQGKKAP